MKTYVCEVCKGTFEIVRDGTWSEEQARAEAKAKFGDIKPEDVAIVCDDCYHGLLARERGKS